MIEKFLEGEEISEAELIEALKISIAERSFVPVLCGSAAANVGIVELVSAIKDYLPNPKELASIIDSQDFTQLLLSKH